MRLHSCRISCAILAGITCSCASDASDNSDNPTQPSYTVTIVDGNDQIAFALSELPVNPSVHVVDSAGQNAMGAIVVFTVVGTSALNINQQTASVTTDAGGIAVAPRWRMGLTGTSTLTANVAGNRISGVTFHATGYDRLAVSKTLDFVDSARAGSPVPVLPGLYLNNMTTPGPRPAGVTVTFVVDSGGGSITGATTTTDGAGYAKVGSWTLGPQPGYNHLTAYVSWPVGGYTVTWTAQGTP
jgi:adhesin/invasin